MADNASPTGEGKPTEVEPAQNPTSPTTGTEPDKKPESRTQAFDPSTLSDEDFQKIFDDQRLFTHDRFKSLNERAKKATELEKAQEIAETNRLKDEKKWQELAEKQETRANEIQAKFETTTIDNRIVTEATKLGITDLDAATKLIDRSGITINDQGVVSGVEEAVKALSESKPYLVDKSKQVPTIGSPTNPATNQNPENLTKFKASDLADPKFYKEHEKEIDASLKAGVPIIDDRYQG